MIEFVFFLFFSFFCFVAQWVRWLTTFIFTCHLEYRVAGESPLPKTIPESTQPGGEDSLVFPASYSSIRAFNRVHGNHTQIEKAREIFKAVQRLKEHIGYGLDPGGCQLATPTRIGRVSNDEDVYAVRHES